MNADAAELMKIHFNEEFFPLGAGEHSPLFSWESNSEEDLFWVIPHSRYFITMKRSKEEYFIEFYKIVNNADQFSNYNGNVITKLRQDIDGVHLSAYFVQIGLDEVLTNFGKKYKFFLYDMDLFK